MKMTKINENIQWRNESVDNENMCNDYERHGINNVNGVNNENENINDNNEMTAINIVMKLMK
jgi:hypothetical protein